MEDRDQKNKPGTFGCHEAVHTVWVLRQVFEEHVLKHPAILTNDEWDQDADKIAGAMWDFYQKISNAHLSAENE